MKKSNKNSKKQLIYDPEVEERILRYVKYLPPIIFIKDTYECLKSEWNSPKPKTK